MVKSQPHWLLDDADAKRYGQALQNALRHLPVQTSQKALDFSMLAFVALQIESPRVALSRQIARGGGPMRGPAQVFPFPGGPIPAGPGGPAQPVRPTGRANQTVRVQQPSQEPVEGFVPDGIDSPLGGL